MGEVQARVVLGGKEGIKEAIDSGEVYEVKDQKGRKRIVFSNDVHEEGAPRKDRGVCL